MTTNNFEPEISNSNLNSAQYYIDDDGGFKFVSPYLSSSNFDGTIPVIEETINAEDVKPGMLIFLDDENYYPVVSVAYDDIDLEDSPSTNITIGYIDSNNELTAVVYDFTDQVDVRYEDWENKDLGSQGWTITSGGNAIFANVGVRGDLEATTLDVGGDAGITYDGTSVVIGASVVINAPITFNGSGSFVTFNDLSSSYALISFVNTVNNRLSASLSSVSSSVSRLVINDNILSASITNLYNAGFVTDSDLVTTGATTITGNNITTGIINANLVNVSSGLTGNRGVKINSLGLFAYDSGSNPTFSIDSNTGNLTAKGTIQAISGYFGDPTYGITIGNNGSQVGLETTTLKFGSQNVSGYRFGAINFYTQEGVSLGSLSATNGNKAWFSSFGNGLGWGTSSDYILLPSSDNTTARARYVGNGFEWRGTSNTVLMSIAGGTGGLRVQNNTGGIKVSGGGDIEIIAGSGGRFVGDGSGLTNLPGGGGGGVTSFKWGDTGLTETGAVAITGAEIITGINDNSIPNAKLINKGITIGSTTRNLGGTFTDGDIDGSVITANTLAPGKISNASNLISIGSTGIPARSTINSINGLSTLQITGSQGLDYVFNLGFTPINLNRNAGNAFLSGVVASANNLTVLTGLSSTLTNNGLLYNATGLLGALGNGTSGQFLRSNGTSAPSWETITAMTNPMTTFGDIIYASSTGTPSTPARLAIGATGGILRVATSLGVNFPTWLARGTAGQVLRVNSGGTDIEWGTLSFMTNPMTSVGDIIYGGTGGVPTRLPAGSNGQFLQYSTTNNRPTWVTFSSLANPMNAAGQMIYGGTSGTPTAVAAGTSGQFLRSGGTGAPTWTSSLFTLGTTAITAGGTTTSLSGITFSGITLNQEVTLGITNAASNGNVLVKGGTGVMRLGGTNIGSTIRIKENINSIDDDERIYSLRPVSFYLKKEHQLATAIETASVQIGFIAEEVFQIIPEAIQYAPESNEIWNYSERPILALAVKAIQDQKNKIDLLENTIAVLEARLDAAGL